MGNYLRPFLTVLLILLASTAHASEPTCSEGTLVSMTGEINNNAIDVVSFMPSGQVTLGVARLKLFANGKNEKLTCTLLGEPTGSDGVGEVTYDHIIVCDDTAQSELSFETTLTGRQFYSEAGFPDLLPGKVAEEYCGPLDPGIFAFQAFTEEAETNPNRTTKGVFQDAAGSVDVAGCVNIVGGVAEVNMMVEGKLCLSNW